MITCPKCEKEMGDLADFCNRCGKELPPPEDTVDFDEKKEFSGKTCGANGHFFQKIIQEANYCVVCGQKIPSKEID